VRRALAGAAFVVLAWPAGAAAHATLGSTEPRVQSRVDVAPTRVVLRFDQVVQVVPRSLQVWTARGELVSGPVRTAAGGRELVAPLRANLPRGAYTVRWRALSPDGHTGSGVFTFGIGVEPPPPTEAFGAAGPTASDDIVRWLLFSGLAMLAGALVFRLVLLPRVVPPRVEGRLLGFAALGAVVTLESGIAGFIMRAEDALQVPLVDLLYGDLSPLANETRFGVAFIVMTLGFAAVLALVFLAWLLDSIAPLAAALALTLPLASGLSLSGHSAVEPNSTWLTQLADWVHLVAAIVWVGGIASLALCVWPVAPELRRVAFVRFSRLAVWLVGALLAAGLYLSVVRLPSVSALWEEDYGRVLLLKLALVAVALTWGAVHHTLVRTRVERGTAGGRVRRSLLGESAVAMAVLFVAAVLAGSPPPPPDPAPPTSAAGAVAR
jgi:copper transport protein